MLIIFCLFFCITLSLVRSHFRVSLSGVFYSLFPSLLVFSVSWYCLKWLVYVISLICCTHVSGELPSPFSYTTIFTHCYLSFYLCVQNIGRCVIYIVLITGLLPLCLEKLRRLFLMLSMTDAVTFFSTIAWWSSSFSVSFIVHLSGPYMKIEKIRDSASFIFVLRVICLSGNIFIKFVGDGRSVSGWQYPRDFMLIIKTW